MDYIKPLTPTFRRQINDSIDKRLRELDECEPNAFVNFQRRQQIALKQFFRNLPDGYPIPMTKGD